MLTINPLHDLIGAEVIGLDLNSPVSDETFATIHDAWRKHTLLVFRDQDINDEKQISFSERFGTLETTRAGARGSGSKVIVLSNMDENGNIVPASNLQVLNNRANRLWHADSSFKQTASKGSLLSARVIPTKGGNTEYVNMRAVYARLPKHLKSAVDGRIAVHEFAHSRQKVAPELVTDAERQALPPVRQALVIDHGEEYGKSLYIGAHTACIEGMDRSESDDLLAELMEFAGKPEFIYAHKWKPHDLILWDNLSVNHRATPFDNLEEPRYMVRTTLAGDAITLDMAG